MKHELEDMELALLQAGQEKAAKDHMIQNLTEEIRQQEELINKVRKEKKHLQEINQKSAEDNQTVEDKCTHLNNVKGKLEQHLDELDDSLEYEKKLRGESEKAKKKAESDLKLTRETVLDLERSRKELEQAIDRKDKEVSSLASKIEEEQLIVVKQNKSIQELQARIEELEGDVDHEREIRGKVEKAKANLAQELGELSDRLDEATAATAAQVELNKKREAELARLRTDYEESNIRNINAMNLMKKKHSDAVTEMADQIDHLSKLKSRQVNLPYF